MNWFYRFLRKFGYKDNNDIGSLLRDNFHPEWHDWMSMLPNRKRMWEVSLNKVLRDGQSQYGNGWDRAAQDRVFGGWVSRVPPALVDAIRNQIDDLAEQYGFRPLGTLPNQPTAVEPWSEGDLEQSYRG